MKVTSCFFAEPAEQMEIPVTGVKENREPGGIVEGGIGVTPPSPAPQIPVHVVMSPNCVTIYMENKKCFGFFV